MKTSQEACPNVPEAAVPASCCQEAARRFGEAREKAKSVTEMTLQFVREHPVRCVVGAFEAGMIIGLLRGRRR
jgi:ElaB/YqjD/DUF883 family membrane-anchored ribosome-binding protein